MVRLSDFSPQLDRLLDGIDIIVFVTCPSHSFDPPKLDELLSFNIPIVLVANKMDLLEPVQIPEYLNELEATTRHVPLPVSLLSGQNLDLIKRFFIKCSQMYM